MVGIHFPIPESDLLKRLEDERIPGKDAMVAEESASRVGGQIFLAGREIRVDMEFRPQPVCDGLSRAAPSVMSAGDIAANFNPHPASAVVIDSVHAAICVLQCERITDHRVPVLVEVAPPFSSFRKPDQYRPHGPTDF